MSKRDGMKRLREFIQRTIVQQAVHSIAWVIALFAFGIGLTLIFSPPEVLLRPTFEANYDFARPHIWGIGFSGLGLLLMVTLSRNPRLSPLFLYGLTIMLGAWGFFTLPSVIELNGSITAVWAYTALGAITAIAGLSIDADNGNTPRSKDDPTS